MAAWRRPALRFARCSKSWPRGPRKEGRRGYRGTPHVHAGISDGERLVLRAVRAKQTRDVALWTRHLRAIEAFRDSGAGFEGVDIESRLADSRTQLARVSAPEYLSELRARSARILFAGQRSNVAHARVRAVSRLFSTPARRCETRRRQECRRGTHECVRHVEMARLIPVRP